MFPRLKLFPRDTFYVNVKFVADYDPNDPDAVREYNEKIELEIDAAPVMLLHSLGHNQTAANTFYGKNGGVWPVLNEYKFNVYPLNYDGSRGYSELLAPLNNDIFKQITEVMADYNKRNIVCTKVDLVGYGMGGLVASHFCLPTNRNVIDGNYYSMRSYKQGMVRRIVTIAAPHNGTLWGNYMLGDFAALRPNATVGFKRLAYRVLKWINLRSFLGARFWGDLDASNKSVWSDIAVNSVKAAYPVNVPMFAIYGKVKDYVNTASAMKSAILTAVGDFAALMKHVKWVENIINSIAKFKVVRLMNIKIEDAAKVAELAQIDKEFTEIQKAIGEQRLEQIKEFLKSGSQEDFMSLIERFHESDQILACIQYLAAINIEAKYIRVNELLKRAAEIYKTAEGINEHWIMKYLVYPLISTDNVNNWVKFKDWVGPVAEILSVILGKAMGLIDVFFEVPFSVVGLMFGENEHDMFVSASSAAGDFGSASVGFYGWKKYRHSQLCQQNEVGMEVMYALREKPASSLKVFTSGNYAKLENVATTPVSNSEADSDDIDLNPEDIFEQQFVLSSDKILVQVSSSDMEYVKFTASSRSLAALESGDLFLALQHNGYETIFPMTEFEDNLYEIAIGLSSSDIGKLTAHCFAKTEDNKIYTSNNLQIVVTPTLDVSEIAFMNSDVIFLDVNSGILLELYAKTSDGNMFNISLPSMGTIWTSSNPSVAYVGDDGLVHALTNGSTKLTASYAGLTASIFVNVGNEFEAPQIITVSLDKAALGKKYNAELQASGTPLIMAHCEWKTSWRA